MEEQKYKNFFDKFKQFKNKQNKQKARGLNDFNLLTTVRKYSDEVYLHSAMIGALLDPNGLHYQHTLFLEKFINTIGLSSWGLDLNNTTVQVEYCDIDLYITDGTKHIIIENKIWADDQPCQIIKYINIIIEKNKNDFSSLYENGQIDDSLLQVIYLTPRNKSKPSEHILTTDNFIEFDGSKERLKYCSDKVNTKALVPNGLKNYKAKFKKINYKNDIIDWLDKCHKEIKNIVNLSEAVRQYSNVVKRVNNNYKGDVMSLESFMKENDGLYKYLSEIDTKLPAIKKEMEELFWEELLSGLPNMNTTYDNNYKGKYPEISIKLNDNFTIFIRREWRSFYGVTINEQFQNKDDVIKELSLEKNTWSYTNPKINFHSYNNVFWDLGQKESRNKIVNEIISQIETLIETLKNV